MASKYYSSTSVSDMDGGFAMSLGYAMTVTNLHNRMKTLVDGKDHTVK